MAGTEYLLAIESSCDETAAAVIDRQRRVLANVVATQHDLHERFGGVVPEIASRAHLERMLPVIDEALRKSGVPLTDLAGIVVASEPGLVGSLLIGLTTAKSLALALNVPLITINHIEAHLYACLLDAAGSTSDAEQPRSAAALYPTVGLVVSGGHTNLYECRSPVESRMIGATIDDAAGEAFDKVAQILGLGYPGGPQLERAARAGNPTAVNFPRTFLHDDRLDFSFSGLKTAVLYAAKGTPGSRQAVPPLTAERVADLAASFQAAVIEVLVAKCAQAVQQTGIPRLCIGGGVAANGAFRAAIETCATQAGFALHVAPREYCTDNAAMGALGWEHFERGLFAPLDQDVTPGLVRMARN